MVEYRLRSHALILMYHRVTELDNDPHLLAVEPGNFAAHLDLIRKHAFPIPLRDLVAEVRDGKVPRRAVVVTFDDGYADNLHQAKPLLEARDMPATVFVAAGQVGTDHEFWWDELDRVLLQPGRLPHRLQLQFGARMIECDLGDSSEYSAADLLRDRSWHIESEERPTKRHRLFMDLFDWLIVLPDDGKRTVLAELQEWAGVGAAGRPTHRTLTWEETARLHQPGLVDIGAHSMTHPALALLTPAEQRDQVVRSREQLESRLDTPVTDFAFPHGSYDHDTLTVLREAGFASSCTSDTAPLWKGADPLQLPRVGVRNWDGPTFERWFKWWMDG
jgi:peptidoglycan/xylan/chitin deacetylase (PgdA/CDA1 family)